MKQQIKLHRFYPYSIDKVWAAITDPEAISEWLMPVENFLPKVGHEFRFRTKPSIGFDGVVNCKVVEMDPPRMIAYHWQGGPMKRPTTVTWQLKQIEDGTVINLTHSGFEGVSGTMIKYILRYGWKKILSRKLLEYLEHEKG